MHNEIHINIKNHNPRKGTETTFPIHQRMSSNRALKIIIPVRGRNSIFLYERRMSMSYVYLTEENVKLQKKGGRYLVGRNLEVVMDIPEETLEDLVLIGRIQVSAEAMVSL